MMEHDITDGGPDMVQFVDGDGNRLETTEANAPYAKIVEDMTSEDARSMYRDLVLVRRVDAEGFALQRQGELGLWPSLLGQEAAQVGAGRAMRPQDYAFPGYREHGVAWCRGVPPENLLGIFRGVNHGGWDSNANNFHLYTIVIGNQMLHATGYAMGVQRDGKVGTGDPDRDTAVMAFTGDGGTAQGDYNEALVFASVSNAPLVFFVQNNQWAISEPNYKQFRIPPYLRARGFGFPGVRVDGNDVLAVYAVTKAALDAARAGQGPTLIEAFTYRMGAHTTSDDPTKYRPAAELDIWKEKDPIKRMRGFMETKGHADASFFEQIDAEADELAARIRKACQEMPDPDLRTMFDHTYAEEHPVIEAEKAEFSAYLDSFEEAGR
ncbi:pyruvate dehydrogenase (acetyl-transferring) E1 component subunit alpha [Calidifontibacter sp. DB0510]|uniref:Pyruvate dehydrogenase (Acetyl-transferring) E1 component subunit alpha n=1 Tax=Metallococcus carri TaxID=1656884 RepID=A0A967B2C0_9MICO|nr:pyruvate dehydrogenase (acetyl-transferring) E1 component subunit alpha [Metallococcus carri]NHN56694.1 pyruvate dehydrogenase (acetyl-transferring) E1 component subunit alpha [Metallococcus carri]NOP37929.1 pyruvate dehydrogenase (acetyl-transferring) E1 component subunit alpha [Calidifontibacter sp. DB2511S]